MAIEWEARMEDLYDRIKGAANNAGLYAIDSHGWLNADDEDPEFLGHALWQTKQPLLEDFRDLRLQPTHVELLAAGEDFYGLMEAARIAAGLALIRLPDVTAHPFSSDNLFWSQTLQAVVALGTATDRLREFARIGFRGGWQKRSGNPGDWEIPFRAAAGLASTAPTYVQEAGKRLNSMGAVLHQRRNLRHQAVHELATKVAKHTREFAREVYEHGPEEVQAHVPYAEVQRRYQAALDAAIHDHHEALEEIKAWYLLLAKVSSDTFVVENWIRLWRQR
jgi:hypothetical protein